MIEGCSPSPTIVRKTLGFALDKANEEVERVRGKLQVNQKPWEREKRMRDGLHDPYYETFRPVLEGTTIVEILQRMKKEKKPGEKFVVMDIMGTGSVFEHLPEDARPDIVIAMTLVDYRTQEEKEKELKKGIYVIGTDKDDPTQLPMSVALPHTWRQFEKLLKELDITTIDFAVARPLGGMHTIPQDQPWFWKWMVQKVYKHLTPHGGVLLTEAPQHSFDFLKAWEQEVNQRGLDITCRLIHDDRDFSPRIPRPAVKIIRHEDSPEIFG